MSAKRVVRLLAAVCVLSATGCSTTVFYNPTLVEDRIQPVGVSTPGRVLIYTTAKQDAYVFKGRPTTFVGSAVVAKIPFGRMTHEIAVATFDKAFSDGAVAGRSLNRPSDYNVIVIPTVTEFDYHYRPLPGSMLKTAADIRMQLRGKVLSPGADVLLDRVYDSNRVLSEGTAGYVPKMLNKVAHTTLCDLMADFARDVKLIVLQQGQAAPAPRSAAPTPAPAPRQPTPAPAPAAPVYTPPEPVVPSVDPHMVPEVVPLPPPDGF